MNTARCPGWWGLLTFTLAACCAELRAADSPRLQILGDAYPRAFFFRHSEGLAASGRLTFEQWDRQFNGLMGIMGKALEEEVPGRSTNVAFFTRFKQQHPDQVVLLHCNGNSRDPRWESERFFAGHWLYYNGATLTAGVRAEETESVLRVSDASLFVVDGGRYRNANDDIGLCRLGADGKPDWTHAEQVQLLAVDLANKTIRVKRGCYGTKPLAFTAGQAYAAAHCTEGPWGRKSNLLWYYNYSTACPRDAQGRTCSDIWGTHLAELFGPDGALAAFDGLEFDVLFNSHAGRGNRGPDCNADGQADAGVLDGVNVYGWGVVEFCRQLRARLGDRKIIQADGALGRVLNVSQRAFHILNGIESEGWPNLSDSAVEDWSGGLNRHFFWRANARPPVFNYINHKFIEPGKTPGEERNPEVPFNIHRLVFAAGVFTDSAICYSFMPPGGVRGSVPVWDELIMGAEKRAGWLGKPRGPAARMATQQPDLLKGIGAAPGRQLLTKIESTEARIELDGQAIKLSALDPHATEFRVRLKGVPCSGPDLFVSLAVKARPIQHQPKEMARLLDVGVTSGGQQLTLSSPPPVTGMLLRDGRELPLDKATGAAVGLQSITLDGAKRLTWHVHPPYKGKERGAAFWERTVTVPPNGVVEFYTGLSENGVKKGDGVVFIVQVAPEHNGKAGAYKEVFRQPEQLNHWTRHTAKLATWAGQMVRLRFITDCGPQNNTVADQSYWADVRVLDAASLAAPQTPPVHFSTWMNEKDFPAGFYFKDIRSPQVDLEFVVESSEPVWLSRITAHGHPDVMLREFEHGLVLANPSLRPCTFDLAKLFPGQAFRRLKGTPQQDAKTNNGQLVEARITLGAQDALFLVRQ